MAKVKRITNSFFEQLWNFDDTKFLSDSLVYKCECVRRTYGTVTNVDHLDAKTRITIGDRNLTFTLGNLEPLVALLNSQD